MTRYIWKLFPYVPFIPVFIMHVCFPRAFLRAISILYLCSIFLLLSDAYIDNKSRNGYLYANRFRLVDASISGAKADADTQLTVF